jgi:ABC-2 type transport system ATP-binding protein/lipopolysaccharide transport system ATP-binding protein
MNCSIVLENVSVNFPVFSSKSRGLLNSVLGYGSAEARRIKAVKGGVTVSGLSSISLKICEGERIGLIGRNGAGKTTLLRILSGIYEPTGGHIFVSGDVSSLTDIMLGMDADSTGYDNILMRSMFLGISRAEARALIPDIENFTELGEYLNLPVRTYSTGMLLRLAFAISTSIRPDILVMDEMIGAGDQHFRDKAKARIDAMLDTVKILVIASHDNGIIENFCNRVVWLRDGRIVADGDVKQVLRAYVAEGGCA